MRISHSLYLLTFALGACVSAPETPLQPAPPIALQSPPRTPLPPAPPLWSGVSGVEVVSGATKTHPAERVIGDVLAESAYEWRRTARLEDALIVPGRDELSLPAGQPLRATVFNFVRPAPPPNFQSRGPQLYNWYWCAQPEPSRNVCIAWVSPGRVRVAGGRDPEQNWVEIAEPKIIEQPLELPKRLVSMLLKEIRVDGVIIANRTREGDSESSYDSIVIQWGAPYRVYYDNTDMRFGPIRAPDGSVHAVNVTFSRPPPAP
jgi:hypothetical protein